MCMRTEAASFPAQQLGHLAHLCYYMGWCAPGDKKAGVAPTLRMGRDGNEFDCVDGLFNPTVLQNWRECLRLLPRHEVYRLMAGWPPMDLRQISRNVALMPATLVILSSYKAIEGL